jgi:hypothetical protein
MNDPSSEEFFTVHLESGVKMHDRPFSPASERNREPIIEVLRKILPPKAQSLFEVGSGTGQHAAFMAPYFPFLKWVTSDLPMHHAGIRSWTDGIANIDGPLDFELGRTSLPQGRFDVLYSANVLHIISLKFVELLIAELGQPDVLAPQADVIFYGPFKYGGEFTSASNEDFDRNFLKAVSTESGIRDFETVDHFMRASGFTLVSDVLMPANNQLLHFQRR